MSTLAYADTSLLVSLYLRDANTHQALVVVAKAARPLMLTSWQQFEMENACQLRLFRQESSRADLAAVDAHLAQDLAAGMVVQTPLPHASVLNVARQLAARHTALFGCRAFDIFHVAAAVHLKASRFLSFDTRQLTLARAAGLNVG